jgi:mannose-1-phosphate guanylyltransferase
MIEDAGKIVTRDKNLITGGIKATEPDMGSDYLRLGKPLLESIGQDVYAVEEFVYRGSSYKETKNLIEKFNVVTHCNHSCWYPELMLEAYARHRPDWHSALMKIRGTFSKPGEDAEIERIYATMGAGPTEEVTKHVLHEGGQVILLPFRWADIGTWGSVYEFFAEAPGDVYRDGQVLTVDSTDSLVKVSNTNKLVAVAGVNNLVVVDTDDVLLIIPKNKIEKIKDIQKRLKENNGEKFL